jgi:hypothetical protein
MNIRLLVTSDQGVWRAQLSLEPGGMTRTELSSLQAHGPFQVQAGGYFTGDTLADDALAGIEFSLTPRTVELPSEFPIIEEFYALDSLDVEMGPRAVVWAETLLARVTEDLVAWLDLSETWACDTVHTIP